MDESATDEHTRAELQRSRGRWDLWSRYWDAIERDDAGIRAEAIEQAGLEPGDAVLDLGCGTGVNFAMLRDAVGPEGVIVGVDLSAAMLERARARVDEHAWENVHLVEADATRPCVGPERFDAAVATTAVSATPDVAATVEHVYDALRPGARFAVYELRLVQSGPARVLNPAIGTFYRAFGNWNTEEDVLAELEARFEGTEVVREYALGTNYVAVAEKQSPETTGDVRDRACR